jgi:hypothetical protein
VGLMLLKIQSFLVTQIAHAIKIIISIAKGTSNLSRICLNIYITGLVDTNMTPNEFQQALAKLHRRKR